MPFGVVVFIGSIGDRIDRVARVAAPQRQAGGAGGVAQPHARLRAISAVIARGAFSWVAIARSIAEAGQMTTSPADPPRLARPAAHLTHLGLGEDTRENHPQAEAGGVVQKVPFPGDTGNR